MDPLSAALLQGGIGAGGSILGGLLSTPQKETQRQRQQRELIDELLASLKGQGSFSSLFNLDEEAFKRSYLEPAKRRFQTELAPQIQQSFIADGQQGGSGLENALTRAGVDLNSILNEQYASMLGQSQNRQLSGINAILGASPGAQAPQSTRDNLRGSTAGYLTSPAFGENLENIFNSFNRRKGFSS